jgi:choline-phosphate cytidylyltransferase
MGDYLVLGINSDEDLYKLKGPTVLNCKERTEVFRHCKFVDEVYSDMDYTPSFDTLKFVDCGYYAHGDDPCFNSAGVDVTLAFKE